MSRDWNHNLHYYDFVLRCMPRSTRRALDVGCGEGKLARRMAERCEVTIGIDTDCGTAVETASSEESLGRLRLVRGDVMTYPFAPESFGFIAAVASLHHFPLAPGLARLRDLLEPGGVLVVVGLYRPERLADWVAVAIGSVGSGWYRCTRGYQEVRAPLCEPRETLSEIRSAADSLLGGADLKRRLLFRYSLVWRKEARGHSPSTAAG